MSTSHELPSQPRPSLLLPLLVLLVALGALWLWWYGPWPASDLNPNAEPRPVTPRGELSEEERTNIEIYERGSPCLVQVTNLAERSGLFGLNAQEVPHGVGSGFVWDKDGHIVTNYHVVEGADAARITLADHSTYDAHHIHAYPEEDIAVLWIRAPKRKLHPVPIGTSHDLKVGQIVYALGDPFGLDQTMTNGIVSALNREITSPGGGLVPGAIQTSAAINPGNSGGPLLDSAGRLIGMNTAIVSPSGTFAGIGFAIPVDDVSWVVPQLIRHGKADRPQLGVQLASDQLARQLGVKEGVLIVKVTPDSPAASAGLRGTRRDASGDVHVGDVIIAVDGQPVRNAADLYEALKNHQAGDTVTVTIIREGTRQDVPVTLQAA
jgi:S1-C subfamily serine protease